MGLLYDHSIRINDYIEVRIPTIEEIMHDEDLYYGMVSSLVSTPYDLMVQLDDIGVDFTTIDDFELFLIVFNSIRSCDTSLIFGDLDLSRFELAVNEQNGQPVIADIENGIVIDRAIHSQIAQALRKIHHLERNHRKAANDEAKRFLLDRARKKLLRVKRNGTTSQLEPLIIAMVNTPEFKYDYDTVKALTIYQFNESVLQIVKKVDYLNRMHGVYSGTVSVKDLRPEDMNWLTHEK